MAYQHYSNDKLVNKTIEKVFINPSNDFMRLQYDKGYIDIIAEGDCCSHSWIEHVENVEALIGATVISVENIDMPDLGDTDEDKDEYIKYYGLKITTTKGSVQFDYRNSSNGYYGGSLEISDNECIHTPQTDFKELTEDF